MKACLFVFVGMALLALAGCGGGGGASMGGQNPNTPNSATHNVWTWEGGSTSANQPGTYGMQGTAAAANVPGGRYGAASWTDNSGNFWLFGGIFAPSQNQDNLYNDLWKYSGGQWTWMGGSNNFNQAGIYGIKGVPASGNTPGARNAAATWKDASGNFWLFGGIGLDVNGSSEILNDLWKYSAGQWTWMGGSQVGVQNQPGIYGTKGTPAPGNIPGGRSLAASWTDASGNFFLFGGSGWDSAGNLGDLNDLWKYSGGQWTWIGGSNVINQPGTYGVQGTPTPANTPGARFEPVSWADASGNFWVLGGQSGTNSFLPLNDFWKYSAGEWTWLGGSSVFGQPGVYGTQGVTASGNIPGARVAGVTWTDAAGNLWLFGGDGNDAVRNVGEMNDLWKFSSGEWTWMSGSNLVGQPGIYGTMGTAAAANIPGARLSPAIWVDSSGNTWIFGGLGEDATKTLGYLNDLWKYQP